MLQTKVEVSAVSHNGDKLAKVRAHKSEILRSEVCRNMRKVGRVELPGESAGVFRERPVFKV